MTWADVEWTEIEFGLDGMNEGVDPRVLPQGSLLLAENCSLSDKGGRLVKRPGTVLRSDGPGGGRGRLVTLPRRNQILNYDPNGGLLERPALWKYPDAVATGDGGVAPVKAGEVSEVLLRQYPIDADLRTDISSDSAYVQTTGDSGYLVYGLIYHQQQEMHVKVLQVRKETTVHEPEHVVLSAKINHGLDSPTFVQVRAAASDDDKVMVSWSTDLGTIEAVVVDCSGPSPSVSALQTIVTNLAGVQAWYHDTSGSTWTSDVGEANWVVAWATEQPAAAGNVAYQQVQYRRFYANGTTLTPVYAAVTVDSGQTSVDTGTVMGSQVRAISILEAGGHTWINYWISGLITTGTNPLSHPAFWKVADYDTETAVVSLAATSWLDTTSHGAEVAAAGWRSAIGLISSNGTTVAVYQSQNTERATTVAGVATQVLGFSDRPITRWDRVHATTGPGGFVQQWAGAAILSKPRQSGSIYFHLMWMEIDHLTERSGTAATSHPTYGWLKDIDQTAVLMRFNAAVDSNGEPPAVAISDAAAYTLGDTADKPQALDARLAIWEASDRGFQQGQSVPYAGVDWTDARAARIGYRCSMPIRYVPLDKTSGVYDIAARTNESEEFPEGYSRGKSVVFGDSAYMAGGVLAQWGADQMMEAGYFRAPNLSILPHDTNGNWHTTWDGKEWYLQAVYETVVGSERIRSHTSRIEHVTITAQVGTNSEFKILVDAPPVSLRTVSPGATPQTVIVLYASDRPGSTTLHRLFEFNEDEWKGFAIAPGANRLEIIFSGDVFSVTGGEQDSTGQLPYAAIPLNPGDISAREVIYTDSGELDNELPHGGCSAIAVHKSRLWVGGGIDPEVLWYSKEQVEGRPAEFTLGQQIRIPGAVVTALASVGDALFVFAKGRSQPGGQVFAILGEGPNAFGDPNSGLFAVRPLATTLGAVSQSNVVEIPGGALFYNGEDCYAIDGSGAVTRVGAMVQDQFDVPALSAVQVPYQQQARFCLGKAAQDELKSYVLVFDWEAGKWAVWTYAYTVFTELGEEAAQLDVCDIRELNGVTYMLRSDGSLVSEDRTGGWWADDTAKVRQKVTTGWLNFERGHGYKMINNMSVLMQPAVWAHYHELFPFGFKVTMAYNYAESGFSDYRRFSAGQLGDILPQDGIAWLRIHSPKQNQPSIKVTLEEQDPVTQVVCPTVAATYDTSTNNRLTIAFTKELGGVEVIACDVSQNVALPIATLVADLNTAIAALGWENEIRAVINDVGGNIAIETVYAQIVSVSHIGSNLMNAALGLSTISTTVGSPPVAREFQSGFTLQSLAFEVGHIKGPRRLPAAQVR